MSADAVPTPSTGQAKTRLAALFSLRWWFRIAMCLLGGACLAVALPIISLCIRPGWPMPTSSAQHSVYDNDRNVMGYVDDPAPVRFCKLGPAFGPLAITGDSMRAPGWAFQPLPFEVNGKRATSTCFNITCGIGWPYVLLRSQIIFDERVSPASRQVGVMSSRLSKLGFIPITPYWPGVIVNTATFAAPLLLFSLAVQRLRSRSRRRRNACVHCGYALIGAEPAVRCPECGTGIPTAIRA